MVRPITADSPIWERTETPMNNLEKLHPTLDDMNNIKGAYKHSLSECSVKLNGINTLLDKIALSAHDSDLKHMAESAQTLCAELINELKINC